ncbi:uncharacterized protein B0T15DRAFT_168514 [Chaetomium strumarium]|uniref:Uncharacterized protein n=1 Tax=Chaetomium strumarium TaxID=1170767 RepID=A0AAJ0GW52_9PEZI|nr:hypothetical protein B0T15DRAFT_168514 [Chaetomium strumarium]
MDHNTALLDHILLVRKGQSTVATFQQRQRHSSGSLSRPHRQSHTLPARGPGTGSVPPPVDDDSTEIIKQPEARPMFQEQLVAEVKDIYAGLVMVERKCIEVNNNQSSQTDPANNYLDRILNVDRSRPKMCTQLWYQYSTCGHIVFQEWEECDEHGLDQCSNNSTRTEVQSGKCPECAYPTPDSMLDSRVGDWLGIPS